MQLEHSRCQASSQEKVWSYCFLCKNKVQLTFVDTVVHMGHTLSCNLSDQEDIEIKTKDFIRHARCLLLNFGVRSTAVKSMLLQSFRMSFYGAALWKLACSELHSLEVVFCLEFGIFPIAVMEHCRAFIILYTSCVEDCCKPLSYPLWY